jgi:hypothetical protein
MCRRRCLLPAHSGAGSVTGGSKITRLGVKPSGGGNRGISCGLAVSMRFTCVTRSPQIARPVLHNFALTSVTTVAQTLQEEISGGVCRSAPSEYLFPESASGTRGEAV